MKNFKKHSLIMIGCIALFIGATLPTSGLANEDCPAGGPGALSCQWESTFNILGIPIIDQTGPSVECQAGYYACCSATSAECIPNEDSEL